MGDAGAIGDGGSIGLAGAPSAGAAGTPSTQPECAPFAQLSLTDFKQTKAAGPGQSALFSATLTNLSDKFIDYTGGILTCQEEGTLVDAVGVPNWNFGILGHGVQLLTFSAQISASAAPGATVHCTAHAGAGLADGKDCANAASLSLDFKVK